MRLQQYTKVVLDNGATNNQLEHARIMKAFLMRHIFYRWGDIPTTKHLWAPQITNRYSISKGLFNRFIKRIKRGSQTT